MLVRVSACFVGRNTASLKVGGGPMGMSTVRMWTG